MRFLIRPRDRNRFLRTIGIGGIAIATVTFSAGPSADAQNAFSPAQFEAMVFQQHGSADLTRERLEKSLDLQIRRLDHSTPLSDAQKQQLRLAGQGDIHRFLNRVIAARERFQTLNPEQADFMGAHKIASPLQSELAAGLFGNRSLFGKVLETTLNKSQREVHRELEALRRQQENEAYVRLYISSLESSLPITASQRESLVELLTSRLGNAEGGNLRRMLLASYQLLRTPEEELAKIFDAGQLAAIDRIRPQLGQIEQALRERGAFNDAAQK